jgi:Domain of Unknown Function (DUF748)
MQPKDKAGSQPPRKHPRRRRWVIVLLILIAVGIVVRLVLPPVVRDYVNRTLDRNLLYAGRIGAVEIHLWRGAYSIRDVRICKTTGNVPVPFFSARQVDFALAWRALFHGRVVGQLSMEQPELNFVDAPGTGESQTGGGGPWLQMIASLFPFSIDSGVIDDGSVHFRTYQAQTPVDVYISHLNATIDDLTNIRRETKPLVTTVQATGMVMDQAKLEYKMALDPFSYRPTFHMAARLIGLDVTKLNDLALAYGRFDFKRGWFDLVIESDAKEGQINGYVKPLFRDLKVFSLAQDVKEDNLPQLFWQALVGATTAVFKNHARDQFGTLIPFSGDTSGATTADILAAVGNVLRNAFVRAYLPRLEGGEAPDEHFKFGPPDLTAALTATNTQ